MNWLGNKSFLGSSRNKTQTQNPSKSHYYWSKVYFMPGTIQSTLSKYRTLWQNVQGTKRQEVGPVGTLKVTELLLLWLHPWCNLEPCPIHSYNENFSHVPPFFPTFIALCPKLSFRSLQLILDAYLVPLPCQAWSQMKKSFRGQCLTC